MPNQLLTGRMRAAAAIFVPSCKGHKPRRSHSPHMLLGCTEPPRRCVCGAVVATRLFDCSVRAAAGRPAEQVAELIASCAVNPELAENKVLEVVSETSAPALSYEDLLEAHPQGEGWLGVVCGWCVCVCVCV